MAEEIAIENGQLSNFEELVTLTLDQVIQHTVMHQSLTSTTCQISLKSKKRFVDGQTYICTYGRTFETGFVRSTLSNSRL